MKILNALYKIERIFLGFLMLTSTILLFANVILRYFFESGIVGSEELIRYMIAWIIFLGMSNCVREGSQISVDILPTYGGPKVRFALALFVDAVGIFFGIFYGIASIDYLQTAYEFNQIASTLRGVPMWIIYLCLPIGCFLYAICAAERLVKDLKTGVVEVTAEELAANAAAAEGVLEGGENE